MKCKKQIQNTGHANMKQKINTNTRNRIQIQNVKVKSVQIGEAVGDRYCRFFCRGGF